MPKTRVFTDLKSDVGYYSVDSAAAYTGESTWTIKNELRKGTLRAVKAGRRTLIVADSVHARAASLPPAKFLPVPVRNKGA
jgi:excisionase family DNA binding protein